MPGIACGIIGLPNVGKSTLFNALTRADAKTENYPFCTIDPNVGVVEVPDERLNRINEVEKRPSAIPAIIEFVDIAGLVEGASKGEGRGNQFLENIHHADLVVHVVRAFDDPNVAHIRTDLDPLDDIRIINLELILADLETAERALERHQRKARGRDKDAERAVAVLEPIVEQLNNERPVRGLDLDPSVLATLDCRFLTAKPMIYVANVGEEDLPAMENAHVAAIRGLAEADGTVCLPVCARIEAELAELDEDEEQEFLDDLGLEEDSLARVIRLCYRHLGLLSFFTVGDKEVRAWTTRTGATAPEAGAVIHDDFRELFIRVEVIAFNDFAERGSRHAVREHGLMRIEGKEYIVQDGDILFFRIGR
ncbi:MAG: redox-regulated ATPase YchF [Lentisphaeria bacterium]|nr:redox-regulated ATPase YchF [Lentisphaeria bacterium]